PANERRPDGLRQMRSAGEGVTTAVFAHGRTTGLHSLFTFSAFERQSIMYDPSNPYASPMASAMDPIAIQWLGTPSPSLRKVANGLGMIYAGICLDILSAVGGAILYATFSGDLD